MFRNIDLNFNRLLKWILSLLVVSILTIIGFYAGVFHSHEISRNSQEWGQFGDFFGGILNPVLSLFNLIVLCVIFLRDLASSKKQEETEKRRHLQILHESVRPYGDFHLSLENKIGIDFKNYGIGPLIIRHILIEREKQQILDLAETTSKIFFHGGANIRFSNCYFVNGDTAPLSKGDIFNLLTVNTKFIDQNAYASHFDTLISFLSQVSITIVYEDLYGNSFTKSTNLSQWSGKGGYFVNLTNKT